ncbi:Uncharacterized protein Adt_41991 [Abeliophyllum distichum]|uniref:Uncharacterized protein n=1 Tax=Abeliophyllum distichum TaxID=126358 RepID=A0ABD1PQF0_9LAMI
MDDMTRSDETKAKAHEDEVDALRSTLIHAQEKAVTHYKAYLDFANCMHMCGTELMKASMNLTNKSIFWEHHLVDPISLDQFLSRQQKVKQVAKKTSSTGRREGISRGNNTGRFFNLMHVA